MRAALVVEDDPFLRVLGVVLDPLIAPERRAAFADFFSNDEPDFEGYCARVRSRVGALFPCEVRLVKTQEELRQALPGSAAFVVESLVVGREELAAASELRVIHKFGSQLRNIDTTACGDNGIKLLTLRRRANMSCAEHAIALMLMLARKLNRLAGRISAEQLSGIGLPYKAFDRRHTPNSNWGRIGGLRSLFGSTLGLIGLGEIGREIALRAGAFDMRVLYHQRSRLAAADERELRATYVSLDELLRESDWVIPQLPRGDATRGFIGRRELALMRPGAFLVNVAQAELVDRRALFAALRARRLGGFALDPLYEAPGRSDDELLAFDNVIITPHIAAQPRFNALDDLADIMEQLAIALGLCGRRLG
jgi:phosphoglycerate dehydrogenase-like enzyme